MSFFSTTKLAPTLVAPYEPTPSGNLPLSFMDRLPASRFLVDSIHVFGNGQQPAMVIRDALSKALVSYYPVAGRLAMSNQGELEIACTRDGVWFVEASADRSLEDVNHLELPLAVPKEELLPYLSPEVEKDLIVMMQVCFSKLFAWNHKLASFPDKSSGLLTIIEDENVMLYKQLRMKGHDTCSVLLVCGKHVHISNAKFHARLWSNKGNNGNNGSDIGRTYIRLISKDVIFISVPYSS